MRQAHNEGTARPGHARRRRALAQAAAAAALVAVLAWCIRRNLPELRELPRHLAGLRYEWLLLGLVGQAVFYLGVGLVLWRGVRATGGRIGFPACARAGVLYFFIGRSLPGPSVPALLVLIRCLGARGPTMGQAAVAASIFGLIDYLAAFALVALAAVWMALGGVAAAAVTALVVLLPTAWRLWGSWSGPRWAADRGAVLASRLTGRLRRTRLGATVEKAEALLGRLRSDGGALPQIFALGVVFHLGGLVTLACVLRALDLPVPWHVLPLADAVSNISAILSFLPGGLGAYEGSLSLVLAGAGTPWAMALTAALLYRAFTFWLLIPPGLWLYKHEAAEVVREWGVASSQ